MAYPITPLCEIARKYACEKCPCSMPFPIQRATENPTHPYTPVYWDLFGFWAGEVKHMLEIGINEGRSLRMWRDFFGNAKIYGLDIRPETLIKEDRIRTWIVDQNDPVGLKEWADERECLFDIIIDDGSHIYDHQVRSLHVLLPYLKPHGVYVIEDSMRQTGDRYDPNGQYPSLVSAPPDIRRDVFAWSDTIHSTLQVFRRPGFHFFTMKEALAGK